MTMDGPRPSEEIYSDKNYLIEKDYNSLIHISSGQQNQTFHNEMNSARSTGNQVKTGSKEQGSARGNEDMSISTLHKEYRKMQADEGKADYIKNEQQLM
jgi:hypothetical protein